MADKKITQHTAGTPLGTDIVPYVSDPTGTPVTKSTTFSNALNSSGARPRNYLANGGMRFDTRHTTNDTSVTTTVLSNDGYGLDRWRVSFDTTGSGTVSVSRADLSATSDDFRAYANYVRNTSKGKLAIYQIVENSETAALRAKTVTFQVSGYSTESNGFTVAILKNTGTADTIPATLITSWNADGATPTFATGISVVSSRSYTPTISTWYDMSVSTTIPVDARNVIVMIYSNNGMSATKQILLSKSGLYQSSSAVAWSETEYNDDLMRCRRFCQTMLPYEMIGAGQCYTATLAGVKYQLNPPMRAIPTLLASSVTLADFQVSNASGGALTPTAISLSTQGTTKNSINIYFTVASGLVAGNATNIFRIEAPSTISVISCEL